MLAVPVHAGTYWVDRSHPAASDGGSGTESAPYKTIQAAVSARGGPGNTVNVKPGTYAEEIEFSAGGSSSAPFTVRSVSGNVIVDGADDFSSSIKWAVYSGEVFLASAVTWSPEQVFVGGVRLTKSSASASSLPQNSFRWTLGQGLYVRYGGVNPGTRTVKVGRRDFGFRLSGKSWITIEGITIARAEDRGITLTSGSNNVVMRSDTLIQCWRYGITTASSSPVSIGPALAWGNGEHGVYVNGATSGVLQDIESHSNGVPNGPEAAGIRLYATTGVTVQRCRLHHNLRSGLLLSSSSTGNKILQNRAWSNGDDGFEHLSSGGNRNVGNVAWENGRYGFSCESSPNTSLYNCVAGGNGEVPNGYDLWIDSASRSGFASSDNVWWSPGRALVKWGSSEYSTLASFASASGQEARSIVADPWFVDPAAADFRPAAGSPLIDSGNASVTDWPATDGASRARADDSATPNSGRGTVAYAERGAFEFLPTGTAPVARLSLSPTSGAPPLAVTANAAASSDVEGTIASYRFDFGDGTVIGPQSSPTATRTLGLGNWTVTVRATDAAGNVAATSVPIRVDVPPVAAIALTPGEGKEPLTVTLSGSGSSDVDGRIANYRFDFGDGSSAVSQSGSSTSHVYMRGTWTATLTVTDDLGATATASRVITVRPPNVAPVASVTVEAPFAPGFRAIPRDSSKVYTEPLMPLPGYLATYTDPVFSTTVTRITGVTGTSLSTSFGSGRWAVDARHHYAKDQPWNSTHTLIAIDNEDATPTRVYLDGETYAVRYEQCTEHRHGDDRWHPSPAHANERISVSGDELAWIDVVDCTKTRSWPTPFNVRGIGASEGNVSDDGRFIALFDATRVFVVDMDPQAPLLPYPNSRIGPAFDLGGCGISGGCAADWVSISPSGKYVMIKYHDESLRVLDVNPVTLALTSRPMPSTSPRCSGSASLGFVYELGHADMAMNPYDNNEDVIIGQEHCGYRGEKLNGKLMGGVTMVRLKDGVVTSLTDPTNEAYAHHVSTRNLQRPGWAYVTYYPEAGKRFTSEIVAVKMDGSKTVQRFAHIHTDFTNCYRCEGHGVPSPDGRRVLWGSNWRQRCSTCGTTNDVKAYVADARALATPGAAPAAPHVVIANASASTDADGRPASYRFDFGDGTIVGPQSSPRAPHTYGNGNWTLTTTVTDDNGAASSVTSSIAVGGTGNRRPNAVLTATPASGLAPLIATLNATGSSDPDGPIASYRFEFGDGSVMTRSEPSAGHTYTAGVWNAKVIVTDSFGALDTATVTVFAATPPPSDTLGPNLVANPSFEAALTGWNAYGTATVTRVTGGQDGGYCARIAGPITFGLFGLNDSPNVIPVVAQAGTKYRISAWVKASASAGSCRLQVREWVGSAQQGPTTFSSYVALGTTWKQITVDRVALASNSAIDLQILDEPVLGSESFYVDNISVREFEAPPPPLAAPDLAAALSQAPRMAPNPMFGRGRLMFATARAGPLEVVLFDAAGRTVRTLADEAFADAGPHHLEVDGRDATGARLPAGIYFYRVNSADGRTTGRFVIAH